YSRFACRYLARVLNVPGLAADTQKRGERSNRRLFKIQELTMLWAVRGTLDNGEDVSIVVEAESQAEAECFGLKRSIPVAVVHPATREDVASAKLAKMLWRYTPEEKYRCFGRSLGKLELTFLVVLGLG